MSLKHSLLVAASLLFMGVGCTQNGASAYLAPTAEQGKDIAEGDETIDDFSPQADILFVVDSSENCTKDLDQYLKQQTIYLIVLVLLL